MRKIKFRAWSVGTNAGEMIYLDRLNLTGDSVGWADDENGTEYEISDKCPLMQFTGLFDKSGKEIWEGDICKYSEWDADCAYGNGGFSTISILVGTTLVEKLCPNCGCSTLVKLEKPTL